MEENQNYGVPAQDGVQNTFVGEEMNTSVNTEMSNQQVYNTSETQQYVTEAQVQEAQVQPAQQIEQQIEQPVVTNSNETKIVVKTSLLKEALKKADTVASKNDLQPVTEVVMFRVVGNIVQVRATDRDNILTVNVPVIEATDGVVMTLKIDKFKQLIDKTTSENVTFIIDGNVVTVVANNGEYKYNQALDLTTNEVIKIPDIDKDSILINETKEFDKAQIMPYLESLFPIVAGVAADAIYSSVHFGEYLSATTGDNVGIVKESLMPMFGTTVFLKASTVRYILSMGTGDKLNIGLGQLNDIGTMCIYTEDYRLYSVLKEGEDEYPIEDINNLLNANTGAPIKVNRALLLSALDRLTIFFASNVVRQVLDFEISNGKVKITNESKAQEVFPVSTTSNINIKFDVKDLCNIAKTLKSDDIIITPIVEDGDTVSFVQISDGDKVVYVIGAAL